MGRAARLKRERKAIGAPVAAPGELEAQRSAELAAVRQERAQACLAALELGNRAVLAKFNCRVHVVARVTMPGGEVMAIETPDFAYVITPLERAARPAIQDRPTAAAVAAPAKG